MADDGDGSLVRLGRLIYGPEIDCKSAREYIEPSSPTTQCNNTIGLFVNGTACYICGLPITNTGILNDGRNPECEHILPIYNATIYLGLYRDKNIEKHNFLNLEYAWAHRTCNQIKSNNLFITLSNGKFFINEYEIDAFLKNIWNNNRSDSINFNIELHNAYDNNINNFLLNQLSNNSELKTKFQNVINHLNTYNAPNLLMLSGVCETAHASSTTSGEQQRAAISVFNRERLLEQERREQERKVEEQRLLFEKKQRKLLEQELKRLKQINTLYTNIKDETRNSWIISFPQTPNAAIYTFYNTLAEQQRNYLIMLYVMVLEKFGNTYLNEWEQYVKNFLNTVFIQEALKIHPDNRILTSKQTQINKYKYNPDFLSVINELQSKFSGGALGKKKKDKRKRTRTGFSRKGSHTKKHNSKTRKRT